MVRRIGRWVGISVVVAAALGGLTSCRPPSSTFTAVQLTDPDAVPGDGACRTTSGACSVQAAIEEANALGGATILLAPGLYDVSGLDATIRADLTIRPAAATGPVAVATLAGTDVASRAHGAVAERARRTTSAATGDRSRDGDRGGDHR